MLLLYLKLAEIGEILAPKSPCDFASPASQVLILLRRMRPRYARI